MNHDEIIESATKTMHAEVCCPCDPQGCDWEHTPEARYARVLADAGLLVQPVDKIALDRWLEQVKAEAWEEGKRAGLRQSDWEHGDTPRQYIAVNPYRQERAEMNSDLAEAWDKGAETAWNRSTPEVNGTRYHWRHEGEPFNPYRTEKDA